MLPITNIFYKLIFIVIILKGCYFYASTGLVIFSVVWSIISTPTIRLANI